MTSPVGSYLRNSFSSANIPSLNPITPLIVWIVMVEIPTREAKRKIEIKRLIGLISIFFLAHSCQRSMLQYLPPELILKFDCQLGWWRDQALKASDRKRRQEKAVVMMYRRLLKGAIDLAYKQDYVLQETQDALEEMILTAPVPDQLLMYREFEDLIQPSKLYLDTPSEELATYMLESRKSNFDAEYLDEETCDRERWGEVLASTRYKKYCQYSSRGCGWCRK